MSILKIAKIGHPILYKKADPVESIDDPSIKKLILDMSETMLDANGIGLAAPQVHVSKQIIIFRMIDEENPDQDKKVKVTALINPKISFISDDCDQKWEGCLSIPDMSGLVKRHTKINYEGYDMNGNLIKQEAIDLQARIIQHEFDHLNGILYINRLVDPKAYGFSEEIKKYWQEKSDD